MRWARQVLPAALTLIEDPHRPRATGSRLFDAEGLATRPRDIVDAGVLTGWTLDLGTARKLGDDLDRQRQARHRRRRRRRGSRTSR